MSRSLKALGIESSTLRGEVALGLGESIQIAAPLPQTTRPSASLVPAIRDLCRTVGWPPSQLELICVDLGPGSYTGLRVGLTCAKTLAFATGAGLVAVGSLEVVAHNAGPGEQVVEVAFDAARGQVFANRFVRYASAWKAHSKTRILQAEDWGRELEPSALVLGPALAKYRDLVPSGVRVGDPLHWWPLAEWVIRLGLRQFRSRPRQAYWTLEPLYLRPSAAEEKYGPGAYSSPQ